MFNLLRSLFTILMMAFFGGATVALSAHASSPSIQLVEGKSKLCVVIDGLPVAVYYYQHDKITRPFFAHVRAPNGMQATRNHPPIDGQDLVDHDTFHPGIWLAFGDINGSDYWRMKAAVRHKEFVESPHSGEGRASFAVRNQYLDQNDPSKVVCEEIARYTFLSRPAGFLLLWDSTFSSDHEFVFGDQEEMGIGFRVATPLRVENKAEDHAPPGNGTILDSQGRINGKQIWGNSAEWCDYTGTMAGQRVGMTLFCHPDNFRPSWFHARDYGLVAANAFGRQAFGKGEKSLIPIKPGEQMRLRYGVLIHSGPAGSRPDLAAAYADYVQQAAK